MYLFEQMGILTLDIPDKISNEHVKETERAIKNSKSANN